MMKIKTIFGNVVVTKSEEEKERLPETVGALSFESADLFIQNAMQDVKIATLEEENANLLLIMAGGDL